MRRSFLLSLLILAAVPAGFPALAQAAERTEAQREAMQLKLEELRERLALTPEQEEKIKPLIQERNEKLKALYASTNPNASRREKLGKLREARGIQQAFLTKVEPILTKEQKKEWEAIRKEMKEAAMERRRSR
jgi:protein CpxP